MNSKRVGSRPLAQFSIHDFFFFSFFLAVGSLCIVSQIGFDYLVLDLEFLIHLP